MYKRQADIRIYVEILPFHERRATSEILDDLRQAVSNIPGLYVEVSARDIGPPIGKDVQIRITGDDKSQLQEFGKTVRKKLREHKDLYNVDDTLPIPGLEWDIRVDREEAGRLGVNINTLGSVIQFLTDGALVGKYNPVDSEEDVDIRIRYPDDKRNLSQLDAMRIVTPQGAIPLTSIVDKVAIPRNDTIIRRDQKLSYDIRASTKDGAPTNVIVANLKEWLDTTEDRPHDVAYKFLGADQESADAARFFQIAGIAILFMMAIILLLQFNSFYHVFLTLLSVILSIYGVILGLTFYPYLSVMLCGVGLIALSGIVVNNNIVLIDTYQRLRRKGYEPNEAALRTAAQRVRPVLLTSVTTIVGLMPLALGWQANIFSGWFSTDGTSVSMIWRPISYVIICGLAFATVLTLVVTPVLLAMPHIWGMRLLEIAKIVRQKLPSFMQNWFKNNKLEQS